MAIDPKAEIPLTQLQRLKFIERQLMWGRNFKARMLMDRFGVSRPQVVSDLKLYKRVYPNNVAPYDPSVKAYTPSDQFSPELTDGRHDNSVEGSFLTETIRLSRFTDNSTLSIILGAIQNKACIELIYASSSNPVGSRRRIFPTRLISTANRLHFRGYCTSKQSYRDFVVSRCLTKPKLIRIADPIPIDSLWEETVTFKIEVNPFLDADGKRLTAHEYQSQLSEVISLPKAMFHYFLIDNNLPASQEQLNEAERQPWAFPILVRMNGELESLMFGRN